MRRFYSSLAICLLLPGIAKPVEKVDWIIRARYVVTMDRGHRVIENGAVAVRGSRIVEVDSQAAIARRFSAPHNLNKPEALLAPGLIDTHTHAPMSLLRAIADDRRLEDWLHNYIFPAESRNVSAEFVRWGTRLACLEMVLAGVTTYTDMYYFEAWLKREVGVSKMDQAHLDA
jgi:5-methylthioadenosine/S-adenosylhomocysteine deaminase